MAPLAAVDDDGGDDDDADHASGTGPHGLAHARVDVDEADDADDADDA